jgi:hypothetical protein
MISHTYRQSGAALIIFLTILILGITGILLSELNTRNKLMLENQEQTRRVLRQAKEALIAFAVTYADTHPGQPQGYLPCPDQDGDGDADASCSGKGYSVIGRFPWKTLGLPPLRDGSHECLWYAVSSTYKDSPKQILTSDTDGLFTVVTNINGNPTVAPSTDRVIAILFAPGKMLEGQNRGISEGETPTECGSQGIKAPVDPINDIENYLDHYNYSGVNIDNATGNNTFAFVSSKSGTSGFFAVDNQPVVSTSLPIFINAPLTFATYTDNGKEKVNTGKIIFNDNLMLITPQDFEPIYKMMDFWVAKRVRDCLDQYAQGNAERYPWPSRLNPHDYDDDSDTYFGRIPQAPLSETKTTSNSMAEIWPLDPNTPINLNLEDDGLQTLTEEDLENRLKAHYGLSDPPDESESEAKNKKRKEIEDSDQAGLEVIFKEERERYRCFNENAGLYNWQWGWWEEWKKMVFFAVHSWHTPQWSEDFQLQFTIASQSNTIPAKMIVLVAGRKLSGQTRIDETQIAEYLEEENNDGDAEFKNAQSSSVFNDVSY